MIIDLLQYRIKIGSYGAAFLDEKKAIKVFKKTPDTSYDHISSVFNDEKKAYLILMQTELLPNIPNFFGTQKIERILDISGNDISSHFYLPLNYMLERIHGNFRKVSHLDENIYNHFHEKFASFGVRHFIDADFATCPISENLKFIDFSVQYHEKLWNLPL